MQRFFLHVEKRVKQVQDVVAAVPGFHRMEFFYLMPIHHIGNRNNRLTIFLPGNRDGDRGSQFLVFGFGITVCIRCILWQDGRTCTGRRDRAFEGNCHNLQKNSCFEFTVGFFLRGEFNVYNLDLVCAERIRHRIHIGIGRHLCGLNRIGQPGDILIVLTLGF